MSQIKWFDRKFKFESEENILPSIIERLIGTPIRIEYKCKELNEDLLNLQPEHTWSIKENIGHLTDLESLWQGRLHDILDQKEYMRATDLNNTATSEARHNDTNFGQLLDNFSSIRKGTIGMLEKIDDQHILLSSLHPRLHTPMRIMDLFLFVADHDDHHLARMSEIIKEYKNLR